MRRFEICLAACRKGRNSYDSELQELGHLTMGANQVCGVLFACGKCTFLQPRKNLAVALGDGLKPRKNHGQCSVSSRSHSPGSHRPLYPERRRAQCGLALSLF